MHTSPLLTKYAASKWRSLVRSGELSGKSLSDLKGMGLLHTPDAVKKEIAGLHRGSAALQRRHGIVESYYMPSRPAGSGMLVEGAIGPHALPDNYAAHSRRLGVGVVEKLRAVVGKDIPVAERLQRILGAGRSVRDATLELRDSIRSARAVYGNTPARDARLVMRGPGMTDMLLAGDARLGAKAELHNSSLVALLRRHEVDESRQAARYVEKLPSNATMGEVAPDRKQFKDLPMWSSHYSPAVPMAEAGHTNFLPRSVGRAMGALRGVSGEQAAMNRAAGRVLPYGQWAPRGKKQYRLLQQRAAQIPPRKTEPAIAARAAVLHRSSANQVYAAQQMLTGKASGMFGGRRVLDPNT